MTTEAMTTMTNGTTPADGLPATYGGEPTFGACSLTATLPAEGEAPPLGLLVELANRADARRDAAERELVRAGRAHLAYSCLTGACVQQAYALAAAQGANIKPLFANCYKKESRAARLAGGAAFAFSYEHGNRCRKTYAGIRERMLAGGGYSSPEQLDRIISEHVQALVAGAYGENDSLALFGPYLSAESMRQELLGLFPAPPPQPGEIIRAETAKALPAATADWEAQRATKKTEFLGYLSCIDAYVERACMYTTDADREAQARRLEQAARRLRAARTQYDLPAPGAQA